MGKRLLDVILSGFALLALAPLILLAAGAVLLCSHGPVFCVVSRVGKDGYRFAMYKLRTMHCHAVADSSMTTADDPHVFLVGRVLRALKIDELPQLWNVLKGDMAVVGPRPETVEIVEHHYNCDYQKTLNVRPGLTSPGSVYCYTHGKQVLGDTAANAEDLYVTRLLPDKMLLELQYLPHSTPLSDLGIILHSAAVLLQKAAGRKTFPKPQLLQTRPQHGEQPVTRAAA